MAAGFLIFGYWYSVVRPRNRTVLRVNDVSISYSAMKRRMAYEFLNNTTYQTQDGAQILPEATYQTLLNELTEITQAESEFGITLTDAEFDEKLRSRIVVSPAADQRTFADGLRKELDKTGLRSPSSLLVRAEAIDTKITDKFKAEAPATTQQAKIEVIADGPRTRRSRRSTASTGERISQPSPKRSRASPTGRPLVAFTTTDPRARLTWRTTITRLRARSASSARRFRPVGVVFYVVRVIDRSDQAVKDSQKPTIAEKQRRDWLKNRRTNCRARAAWCATGISRRRVTRCSRSSRTPGRNWQRRSNSNSRINRRRSKTG